MLDPTEETPYTSLKAVLGRTFDEQRAGQVEPPRRILRMREASQEVALAAARHFFASGIGQKQVGMAELHEKVPATTTERTTLASTPAITSTVLTTSGATTTTGAEAGSPRSFLPNGSPSRPTATAICRP